MKKIFLLSGENVNLGMAEIEALGGKGQAFERVCIASGCKEHSRLAYVQHASKYLFDCRSDEIVRNGLKLNGVIGKKEYCVRVIYGDKKKERAIANAVWSVLKNPKVNLRQPKIQLDVYIIKDKFYFGERLWENSKEYMGRWPHKKPGFHPTTIIPKLAKACVSLTGLKKGTVLDPFCGTGSILVEAGLMKLNAVGYDLDDKMLVMAKKNLKHYGISKYKLTNMDSTQIKKKEFNAIVTDVPYNRMVKFDNINKMYDVFFSNISRLMKKEKMIIVVHDKFKVERLKKWFKIERNISHFVHQSLTRKILVLVKK